MSEKQQNDSFRDKCSAMIAPHFEILFKITDILSKRYGIVLPTESICTGRFLIAGQYQFGNYRTQIPALSSSDLSYFVATRATKTARSNRRIYFLN